MNRFLLLLGLAAAAFTLPRAQAQAVSLYTLKNDYRNVFSYHDRGIDPLGSQFTSGTAFGGFATTRLTADGSLPWQGTSPVIAGGTSAVAGPTAFGYPQFFPLTSEGVPISGQGVVLHRAIIGRPVGASAVSYALGSVIPTPTAYADGTAGSFKNRPLGFDAANAPFYYSKHAEKVFATQVGVIEITWESASPGHPNYAAKYVIGANPIKPVRKIFWTEKEFKGPPVIVPVSRVSAVNIVYTENFKPKTTTPYVSPNQVPVPGTDNAPVEDRTLWYDDQSHSIRAFNVEGRVFVEYLGNLRGSATEPQAREPIGFEIVDVIKEIRPQAIATEIGEVVFPPDHDTSLEASVSAGLNEQNPFLYRHVSDGGATSTLYAIRATRPVASSSVISNEVLIYWLEAGEAGVRWPKYYAGYVFQWPDQNTPDGIAKYSLYARPSSTDQTEVKATGVLLATANNPSLVYQSDPTQGHAKLDPSGLFYTNVTPGNPEGFSLIRYTNGDTVWFERVLSRLDTNFSGFTTPIAQDVGARIVPPDGADSTVGYIRPATGTAYDVNAYKDPFVVGFEDAARGAIIGVNALAGKNELEVWWFKKSRPVGAITPTSWPQFVSRYQLKWPDAPPEIVLASNEGSGDLEAGPATGTIYHQNDPTRPGYNPNEEHALLLGGRAWALRDDLNIANSSKPYVLVSYVGEDERPAMKVFRVLRDKPGVMFDYAVTAGGPVPAPMPLPLLPAPIITDPKSTEFGKSANKEVGDATDPPGGVVDDAHKHYNGFTFADRKGAHWVYRGPHFGGSPSFRMQYRYAMQAGFYLPGETSQPAPGALLPYLRPYANGHDASGGFSGDPVAGDSLQIVFRPAWPASAPELRVAETLTLPKVGLPAVRGQSSVRILYEQSVAKDVAINRRSAFLYDPTRMKTYAMGAGPLATIPDSIKTSVTQGKTFFPNLPPHLSSRFYFDPSRGAKGSLVLIGQFVDAPIGEKYLHLNTLSEADLKTIQHLDGVTGGATPTAWDQAIEELETEVETFKEDEGKRGTFIVDQRKVFRADQLPEVSADDTAVDSYALAGIGGGSGYVVLLTGNGSNTNLTPADQPIALSILKVAAPVARGELKVITSSNPLDEKVTLQHSSDFAAKPEDYDFQWIYTSSTTPPPLYTIAAERLLGNGNWQIVQNPGPNFADYRGPMTTPPATLISLPGTVHVNNGQGAAESGKTRPFVSLRRTFSAEGGQPLRLFLSLDLGTYDGAAIFLNGAEVADFRAPARENTATLGASAGDDFSPLPVAFEISPGALRTGDLPADENVIAVELYSSADVNTGSTINVRLEAAKETDHSDQWQQLDPASPHGIAGKVRHIIQGSGPLTLADGFYAVRYRVRDEGAGFKDLAEGGGWSKWTEPQLVEGWIKRALGGINPFNQRITDLYNHAVDTQVSLISQSGKPWEGDVALNLENINNFGLIEIYETIQRRGIGLSIADSSSGSFTGANQALLLAGGYLCDLYTILGNEAYADAQNPTVSFTANGIANDVVTSLFPFKGQVATVLDEELQLLRGRDDSGGLSTHVTPVYNRMFWNYTRGIDAGEAVYAANYAMKDENADGVINVLDAAIMYPQGHGDAYGHYLTALKSFYGLLQYPKFSWIPEAEMVSVGGISVEVNYRNERKFAGAAAALSRSARQIVDLTFRQSYLPGEVRSWAPFRDTFSNSATGITRAWGVDEWSARGGQGAYLNWVAVNSLLPATAESHLAGVQRVDRTTVPELEELATNAAAIQSSLANADARLNPLGLGAGAMAFDISPAEVDAGRTHYEQVYSRALTALANATSAYGHARTAGLLLRQQSDSAAGQAAAVTQQERAYSNQLIEIYGTPYADDIGAGKTYVQSYDGPDLIHYAYIDLPGKLLGAGEGEGKEDKFTLYLDPRFVSNESSILNLGAPVAFSVSPRSDWTKPEEWKGRRSSPGRLQAAMAEVFLARQALVEAAETFSEVKDVMDGKIALYTSAVNTHTKVEDAGRVVLNGVTSLESIAAAADTAKEIAKFVSEEAKEHAKALAEAFPKAVGLSNDLGALPRSGTMIVGEAAGVVSGKVSIVFGAVKATAEAAAKGIERKQEFDIEGYHWDHENKQLLAELRASLAELVEGLSAVNAGIARMDQAERNYAALVAEGDRVQAERAAFRQRAAAVTQGYRTNDYLFRAIRNEALERYQALFDLAAKYTYLAARAYDYETGLLDADGSTAAASFFRRIVRSRVPGVVGTDADGRAVPQSGGANSGDPGLSGALAQMSTDWSVAKTRLGFNNPDRYRTTFSLRREKYRLLDDSTSDEAWRQILQAAKMDNVLDDPDVRRYALQIGDGSAPVPGLVIEFGSMIQPGTNFFGNPLAGGDHTFSPGSFATKIRASGIAFKGYPGMDSPTTTSGALSSIGATSPADPAAAVASSAALNATPYVYLIPAGTDVMSAPPIGGASLLRSWSVEDQAIPLPFNIGGTNYAADATFVSADSLSESVLNVRKHQPFRAVPDGTAFSSDAGFTNARLIGRSAWNSRWKIVIPGGTLLASPTQGLQIFTDNVKDIKLHLETYSYSGN